MDFGKFSREFKAVKKAQLEEHFNLVPEENDKAGRWQITLFGVDPLPPQDDRPPAREREREPAGGGAGGGSGPRERNDTPIGRFEGSINGFDEKKGYGFIQSPEVTEGDVYFRRSELPTEARTLPRIKLIGLKVEFECVLTPDGKPRAESVALVESPAGDEEPPPGGGEKPPAEDLPELPADKVEEMKQFLEEQGGAMDYGRFANHFPGIKKAQLLPHDAHFTLVQEGDSAGGRWQITLFGVDPLPKEENVEEISFENGETRKPGRDRDRDRERAVDRAPPVVIEPTESLWLIGCVKKWDGKKQFGFIVADGADDVFLHRNDLPESLQGQRNMLGVELAFELGTSEDGKPRVLTTRPLIQPDGRGGWQLRRAKT